MLVNLAIALVFLLCALRSAYLGWAQNWPDRVWLRFVGAVAMSGGLGLVHFLAFVRCSV